VAIDFVSSLFEETRRLRRLRAVAQKQADHARTYERQLMAEGRMIAYGVAIRKLEKLTRDATAQYRVSNWRSTT
jgi:hypothetical protein